MNKQELIEKIKNLSYTLTWNAPRINREIVIDLIEQLNEPQKPVVPQFVADWYEDIVDEFYVVLERLVLNYKTDMPICKWFFETEDALTILINMHQFDYTVEKERRYLVSLRNGQPLVKTPLGKDFYFNQNILAEKYKATRKELEQAGFGWVFDCPGVEIEEVER